jgi:phosphoglycolate phosphatase-like HAD superfamily hydrolase
MSFRSAALLDLDGTLVDSVYHHVVCWQDALRDGGHDVPAVRIHAAIGMGSDRLLPWLLGGHVEDADALTAGHKERFLARADDLRPTPGARELLADLRAREVPFVIATSAGEAEREVLAACGQLGVTPDEAMLVGDAPWDAVAAERIGVRAIGVRCGGFSDASLREAGCRRIVDDPAELIGQL